MNEQPRNNKNANDSEARGPGICFWLISGIGYVVFFGALSYLSPCGAWFNSVIGVPFWLEHDPGGWYMISAHQMFMGHRGVVFPGHPGLTLQLILFFIQKIYFIFAGAGSDFTHFIAKHIVTVFIFTKIAISVLHVASFYLLYLFSMRLTKNQRAAITSVLAYATCFPVLFYTSRISVEPLAVIFFLSSFLAAWKCADEIRENKIGAAVVAAGVSAILAVSGIVTKMHYLIFLPVFIFAYIVFGERGKKEDARPRRIAKGAAAVVFTISAVITFVLYSQLINWKDFIWIWRGVCNGSVATSGAASHSAISGTVTNIIEMLKQFPFKSYFPKPGMHPNGIFAICETPFVAFSVVGLIAYLIRERSERSKALWAAASAASILPAWFYNGWFHYLFILLAFVSVFFGYYADVFFGSRGVKTSGTRLYIRLAAIVMAFHFFAVCMVVQSRLNDVKIYAQCVKPYHEAISKLGPGETAGILTRGDEPIDFTGLFASGFFTMHGGRNVLSDAISESVRYYNAAKLSGEEIESRMRKDRVAQVISQETINVPVVFTMSFKEWTMSEKPVFQKQ
jgi:hypothetical protein